MEKVNEKTCIELKSSHDWQSILNQCDTFLLDCDGVLWHSDSLEEGSAEFVIRLKELKKSVYFVTNNSTSSREQYLQKFIKLGIPAKLEEIMCSSYATGYYLKHQLKFNEKLYLIGQQGLKSELESMGLQCYTELEDSKILRRSELENLKFDSTIKAVVIGYDIAFNYTKLFNAVNYLQDPECLFIATDVDTCEFTGTRIAIPITGCLVSAIKTATNREPIVIGKPNIPMFDCCRLLGNIIPDKTVMIGDRLTTDIQFGIRNGLHTVLVLSGGTSLKELDSTTTKPDYYTSSVKTLLLH